MRKARDGLKRTVRLFFMPGSDSGSGASLRLLALAGTFRTPPCYMGCARSLAPLNPTGLLFVEVSSLTGENVQTPFTLAARTILPRIESGEIDPEAAGTGISYGERQLRTVASHSRLGGGGWGRKRRRGGSVSISDLVEHRRCSC